MILAENVPYLGIKGITVNSNNCTGILAIESTLVFFNTTRIWNNTALTGAGIRLCSSSTIYLKSHTDLIITNNSVQQTGGGIQVNSNCLISIPRCFYQYSRDITNHSSLLKTVNFTISNNHAPKGGDNIYGGSIDYCYLLYVKRDNKSFINHLHVPNNTINHTSSVTSDPQHICFNYSSLSNVNFTCNRTVETITMLYPGENVTLPIRVVGQSFGSVPGTVFASIEGSATVDEHEKVQTVNITGENVTYTVYSLQADNFTDNEYTLYLNVGPFSDTSAHEFSKRYLPAEIKIHFKDCPFGFINTEINSKSQYACQCASLNRAIINCSIQDQTIIKQEYSWLGEFRLDNQTYLASSKYCPLDYCDSSFIYIKSSADHLSQDEQCQYSRTGILCGSCKEGWSLVLGSSECREKCSNVWLLLILPFALAGLLLVVVIHFLNLTVTMGTVCGLIFYANIIQDYSITLLSQDPIPGLTPILQIFLSWLNLDLGISTCFYDGMGTFGKTMLLFVFPIYIWLISAIIIILSHRYIFFTRLVGENAVKVLSTLFLLSYSKMFRVTFGILNLKIVNIYAKNSIVLKLRWILDGNIPYFDPQRHLALFVIAVLFIMLLLPFTMALLCISHVYSLSNCCRVFSWINKLKPFFDTYTGPFKDKASFWTGLLLLIRLLLLIVHALDYKENMIPFYIIIAVCLFLSAIIVFFHGVYKKKYLNILEYFFILNIIVAFQIHTYKEGPDLWKSITSHLLVSSAFIAFLGIVAYHIYLKFSHLTLPRRFVFWRHNAEMDLLSFEGVRSYDSTLQR